MALALPFDPNFEATLFGPDFDLTQELGPDLEATLFGPDFDDLISIPFDFDQALDPEVDPLSLPDELEETPVLDNSDSFPVAEAAFPNFGSPGLGCSTINESGSGPDLQTQQFQLTQQQTPQPSDSAFQHSVSYNPTNLSLPDELQDTPVLNNSDSFSVADVAFPDFGSPGLGCSTINESGSGPDLQPQQFQLTQQQIPQSSDSAFQHSVSYTPTNLSLPNSDIGEATQSLPISFSVANASFPNLDIGEATQSLPVSFPVANASSPDFGSSGPGCYTSNESGSGPDLQLQQFQLTQQQIPQPSDSAFQHSVSYTPTNLSLPNSDFGGATQSLPVSFSVANASFPNSDIGGATQSLPVSFSVANASFPSSDIEKVAQSLPISFSMANTSFPDLGLPGLGCSTINGCNQLPQQLQFPPQQTSQPSNSVLQHNVRYTPANFSLPTSDIVGATQSLPNSFAVANASYPVFASPGLGRATSNESGFSPDHQPQQFHLMQQQQQQQQQLQQLQQLRQQQQQQQQLRQQQQQQQQQLQQQPQQQQYDNIQISNVQECRRRESREGKTYRKCSSPTDIANYWNSRHTLKDTPRPTPIKYKSPEQRAVARLEKKALEEARKARKTAVREKEMHKKNGEENGAVTVMLG